MAYNLSDRFLLLGNVVWGIYLSFGNGRLNWEWTNKKEGKSHPHQEGGFQDSAALL